MSAPVEDGFYIAVVGDGDEGEPIRVQDGSWYSVGCDDPHDLGSILIIRPLDISVPTRAERERRAREHAEEAAWEDRMSHLRQRNYADYRREFYKRHGRYPGHRRWP